MEPWRELKLTKNKNECARLFLLIRSLAPELETIGDDIILYDIRRINSDRDIKKMEKFLNHVYTRFYNKGLDKNKKV